MKGGGQDLEEALTAAAANLGPAAERSRALVDSLLKLLPSLLVALVVVLLFWLVGRAISRQRWLIRRLSGESELIEELLRGTIPMIMLLLGLVTGLNIIDAMGILSAVLGAAGVLGIAVGFAIRDTIENFIASVMLSLRQPFRPKDYVDIDGREGFVVRLTSRATILMTADGVNLRIPNSQVFKGIITNYSRNAERRIPFQLGIDAADDPRAAMDCGLARIRELGFALDQPPALAWIEEVGDSNILISFAFWIDQRDTDYLKGKTAAIRSVKDTLEEEGFTLPEPIYRVRVDQLPEVLNAAVFNTGKQFAPSPPKKASPKAPRDERNLDVAPDTTVEEKVEADRAHSEGLDLLNTDRPTEFGDEGMKGANRAPH